MKKLITLAVAMGLAFGGMTADADERTQQRSYRFGYASELRPAVRHEILVGELASLKRATLPIFGALGGLATTMTVGARAIGKGLALVTKNWLAAGGSRCSSWSGRLSFSCFAIIS